MEIRSFLSQSPFHFEKGFFILINTAQRFDINFKLALY